MIIIGENLRLTEAASHPVAPRSHFRCPRSYQPSGETKIPLLILSVALLFSSLLFSNEDIRTPYLGFIVLFVMATMAYAFGSSVTLHADKIELKSAFFIKRYLLRSEVLGWRLQLTETRGPIFLLLLNPGRKDVKRLLIEINFEMDPAFFAWFPGLHTLVQDRSHQFPGLQCLTKA